MSPLKPLRQATAHRPAADIGAQVLVGQLQQDLDVGRHLHRVDVALHRRFDGQRLQRVELLVADRLARGGQHFGGLAVLRGARAAGAGEHQRERARSGDSICHVINLVDDRTVGLKLTPGTSERSTIARQSDDR